MSEEVKRPDTLTEWSSYYQQLDRARFLLEIRNRDDKPLIDTFAAESAMVDSPNRFRMERGPYS
ncbi:MAG: hypothetical protein VX867_07390 [Pseudomonadota bacterium]|nr:hypothetical protein [Pseudomonadota bacterium]